MSIYETLGVRTVINAWGTVTTIGGSIMRPEVLAAMTDASESFVSLTELHTVCSARIAEWFGVEAACITAGADAGLAISTAACLSHGGRSTVSDVGGGPSDRGEVLILGAHRFEHDQAVGVGGARLVQVGSKDAVPVDEIESGINERSVMFLYIAQFAESRGSLPLKVVADALRHTGIPIVVDAAAEVPPVSNIARYFSEGASLVVVSGGKEIGGPQSSGLILGDRSLVETCVAHSSPHFGVGRTMKVDKETMVGLLAAVDLFFGRDYDAVTTSWYDMNSELCDLLRGVERITVREGFASGPSVRPNSIPRVFIGSLPRPAESLQKDLMDLPSPIAVGIRGDEIMLNPQCLSREQIPALIRGITEVLAVER